METDYDVVIIGAGISGINVAYRLQSQFPSLRYVILDNRENLGGTWDLFKYPGIRSDSDLFTFGFDWYPWYQNNPIASGPDIIKYLEDAATKHGIKDNMRFQHKVLSADWSSTEKTWSLTITKNGQPTPTSLSTQFLIFGTGYYSFETPLQTQIPGLTNFSGQVIHPQFWPQDLDYTDKKIVIIGSGATAITLLPTLAQKAAKVTMLQRSPSYIISVRNRTGSWLTSLLPTSLQHRLARLRSLHLGRLFYLFSQSFPNAAKRLLTRGVARQLPAHIPLSPHFTPSYNPWAQRLCAAPDGDFFKSLHTGRADVQTDTIRQVTASGIELDSGSKLDADLIVTATGLKVEFGGRVALSLDGVPYQLNGKYTWRGMMFQDLPNAAFLFGYANASWTLGADATSVFICRLWRVLEQRHALGVVPRLSEEEAGQLVPERFMKLNSTYINRALADLPLASDREIWSPASDYFAGMKFAKKGSLEGLEFLDVKD
ncbi:hypothetical protein N7466_002638 [Penicillium verhagenii]|uniref:uncharacterized protein n=1 Tax=Penicillium verhagenii TaxID=1562060 RepID=UPI00254552D7|nr:uncharacterized protein N7466_002638 [Penicillium verhagenii]KAJ5939504.1 hypothetical protein N7466_002638 [Penicillium verhagenii]